MIDSLPDPVLGRVLAFASASGPSLPLVCRRWRSVYLSEPALWRSFRLAPGSLVTLSPQDKQSWFATKHALLQHVAVLVERVEVVEGGVIQAAAAEAEGGGCQLSDFLMLLEPRALTEAVVHYNPCPPPAVAHALARLQRLSSLELHSHKLPPEALLSLVQLPRLRSLSCSTSQMDDCHIEGITALRHLTRLALVAAECPLPSSVLQLTRLSQLQHLALFEHNIHPGMLAVPAPADFPPGGLKTFDYNPGGWLQVAGAEMQACKYSAPGRGGGTASCTTATGSNTTNSSSNNKVLWLYGVQRMDSLQDLVDAVLPAGAKLSSLSLWNNMLGASALAGCSQLSSLSALELGSCSCKQGSGSMDATLQALLVQVPHLAHLTIKKCLQNAPPACLAGVRSLKRLLLPQNRLVELPPAPYLPGLEELDLSNNQLARLPPSLAAATSLQRLKLRCNPRLKLNRSDVDCVLARMPCLVHLDVGAAQLDPAVLDLLRHTLPRLKVT